MWKATLGDLDLCERTRAFWRDHGRLRAVPLQGVGVGWGERNSRRTAGPMLQVLGVTRGPPMSILGTLTHNITKCLIEPSVSTSIRVCISWLRRWRLREVKWSSED